MLHNYPELSSPRGVQAAEVILSSKPAAMRATLALALICVVLCYVVPFPDALCCRYAVLRDDDLIEAISEWDGKKLVLQALQQR